MAKGEAEVQSALRIAKHKKPKEEVNYRKGDDHSGYCRNCRFFEIYGKRRCTQVQGVILAPMVCDLFKPKG
jgi:hypothetical protein